MQKQNNIKLLAKPIWSLEDIMAYTDCKSRTTASKIRREAIKKGGSVRAYPQKTKRDSVLEALGLNYKDEVKKLRMLEE